MPLRLTTLALAQALDLSTFWVMMRIAGPAAEANPLVSGLFATSGFAAVVLAKILLVILVGSLGVAAMPRRGSRTWGVVGGLPLALAIAFGLIGGISNAAVILG